jgi:hypothetical protein
MQGAGAIDLRLHPMRSVLLRLFGSISSLQLDLVETSASAALSQLQHCQPDSDGGSGHGQAPG